MRRFLAAVAVGFLAVGGLALAGSASAAPAPPPPAPGELWRNFPLEPRTVTGTATTPAAPAPARPAGVGPAVIRPPESREDAQTPWILLGVGAGVLAAVAAAVLYGRRRRSRPVHAVSTGEPEPETVVTPNALTPTPARAAASVGRTGARTVERAAPSARRAEPSLVEMLSPRLHVDEEEEQTEHEREEQEEEPEKQEEQVATTNGAPAPGTCEIRWWHGRAESRFYVEGKPPLPETIESPAFRARGRSAPVRNTAAQAAHEVVVQSLVAAGWRPDGRGAQWFSHRFTSIPVGEEAEPAEAPEEPAATRRPDEQESESESKDGRNSSFVW